MSSSTYAIAGDREPSLQEEFASSFANASLNLILLSTEQCNFRCSYCYEDFAIGRMAPDVVAGVKRLIDRRIDGLRYLSISWFGGEPLLARDIIEDISAHVVATARWPSEFSYHGDMTTNGSLLTASVAQRLSELGVRSFQVSLDGPQAIHDNTRIRASGNGTFDQIWRNLVAVRDGKADVNILLRIHLTPENVNVMPEFLTLIRETFLLDPRFKVLLKPIERMGGLNNDNISVIPHADHERILATLRAVLGGENADCWFAGEKICYAARANSIMIRADGRIGKCTVALSDSANTIGRLLPDGSLQIDNTALKAWFQGWEKGDRSILGCPYASIAHAQGAATSPTP